MIPIRETRLRRIFTGMKSRCYNPNDQHYKWYGGKGITICDEWLGENGVQLFVDWAFDNGYEENLSIDRIDSSGNYEPSNCRWVTVAENTRFAHCKKNTVYTNLRELREQTGLSQQKFSEYFGIPRRTIQNWELGINECNQYIIDLMEYKLRNEGKIE